MSERGCCEACGRRRQLDADALCSSCALTAAFLVYAATLLYTAAVLSSLDAMEAEARAS